MFHHIDAYDFEIKTEMLIHFVQFAFIIADKFGLKYAALISKMRLLLYSLLNATTLL